jgi:hypothetical protein
METTTNPEAREMTYYGPVCTITAARNFLRAARAKAAA